MKFFFPDSQDQVDPNFDFQSEEHPPYHQRQRDDFYAHEVLGQPISDGILVSMGTCRYTFSQRQRLLRLGVREFFRLDRVDGFRIETLGDCGAFSYVEEHEPPFSVEDVHAFYSDCRFDAGVSPDHVILGYSAGHDQVLPGLETVPEEWRRRQDLSIEFASEFLALHKRVGAKYQPVGAAQGWSPESYAHSVRNLVKMGYKRIGLGGLVSLKTNEILDVLAAVHVAAAGGAEFHLFGVTRCERIPDYQGYGVTSIDSTSPFRQAFKDDRDNYHTANQNFVAVRVPQVDANRKLKNAIRSGKIEQAEALRLESACLRGLRSWGTRTIPLGEVLDDLEEYENLYAGKATHREAYAETLRARPWETCQCRICRDIGIDVVIFRGSERNKRRGFHNLWVFHRRVQGILSDMVPAIADGVEIYRLSGRR